MSLLNNFLRQLLLCILASGLSLPCFALDPDPRRWGHIPIDANFGGFAYAYTETDIFSDPTLLLEDVEMKLDTLAGKYIRTFKVFKKSARIDVT
jgi:hypothetical protein